MKLFFRVALCVLFMSAMAFLSGCKSKTGDGENPDDISGINANGDGTTTPGAFGDAGAGVKSPDQWTPIPGVSLPAVYFAYDQSNVGTSEYAKIKAAADHLAKNPDHCLIIEGHCDNRGSLEYNRALGERRAISIRDALVGLGVADKRMQTVSYGEEKPAVQGDNEAAWAKNRRGELIPAK